MQRIRTVLMVRILDLLDDRRHQLSPINWLGIQPLRFSRLHLCNVFLIYTHFSSMKIPMSPLIRCP